MARPKKNKMQAQVKIMEQMPLWKGLEVRKTVYFPKVSLHHSTTQPAAEWCNG